MINCPHCNIPVDVAKENYDQVIKDIEDKQISFRINNLTKFNLGVGSRLIVELDTEIVAIKELGQPDDHGIRIKVKDSTLKTPPPK